MNPIKNECKSHRPSFIACTGICLSELQISRSQLLTQSLLRVRCRQEYSLKRSACKENLHMIAVCACRLSHSASVFPLKPPELVSDTSEFFITYAIRDLLTF